MPVDKRIKDLAINVLTDAQYKGSNVIDPDQFYLVTDAPTYDAHVIEVGTFQEAYDFLATKGKDGWTGAVSIVHDKVSPRGKRSLLVGTLVPQAPQTGITQNTIVIERGAYFPQGQPTALISDGKAPLMVGVDGKTSNALDLTDFVSAPQSKYRHSVKLVANNGQGNIVACFDFMSKSNTPINSYQDLATLCKGKTFSATGYTPVGITCAYTCKGAIAEDVIHAVDGKHSVLSQYATGLLYTDSVEML